MKQQWQEYCDKYIQLSTREQNLIWLTGLVAVIFMTFHFLIDSKLSDNQRLSRAVSQQGSANKMLTMSINEYQQALAQDPNTEVRDKIKRYEAKLAKIDSKLLMLTSELINPVQMRYALLELLKVEKNVSLLAFELIGAQPLITSEQLLTDNSNPTNSTTVKVIQANDAAADEEGDSLSSSQDIGLNLYRHGIKITLTGDYFALQNYLRQLEALSWTFFWQEFDFKVKDYPMNELSIEIYSLGSKKEFIGV